MRLKLDENLPSSLATALADLGHDAHTAHGEGLAGKEDQEVWRAAQRESRFFLTMDLDFSDVRRFVPGSHHGILLLRLLWPSPKNLARRVIDLFRSEDATRWPGCLVVATEHKIRLSRPPSDKQNA